jgi:ATP-dependent protease ClpP protease subunit
MAAAIDSLRLCPIPVIVTGQCRSAAVPIVAWGKPGERAATRLTQFTVHPGKFSGESELELPGIQKLGEYAEYVERMYAEQLELRTRRTAAWWLQFGAEERDFDAKEAKKFGLIDAIV